MVRSMNESLKIPHFTYSEEVRPQREIDSEKMKLSKVIIPDARLYARCTAVLHNCPKVGLRRSPPRSALKDIASSYGIRLSYLPILIKVGSFDGHFSLVLANTLTRGMSVAHLPSLMLGRLHCVGGPRDP